MINGKYIDKNGFTWYFENDKIHRKKGPAIIYPNNDKNWYKNGKLHREDGPAIEFNEGDKRWFYYGIKAKNEEEFYNEKWRKEVLLDLV